MKTEYIDYLVCPECKSNLDWIAESKDMENSDIISGTLKCHKGHKFQIRGGVPRFVEVSKDLEEEQTKDSFGGKWKRVHDYGFDLVTKKFHLNWFRERFGFPSEKDLKQYLSSKKLILDVGCGTGRLSNTLAEFTHNLIFAFDISESVDVAVKNLKSKPNVCVIQADLNKLPFPEKSFDLVICDMVLHHTPKPEKSFKYLAKYIKPSGEFFNYVYKVKTPAREFSDTALRAFTTKMTPERCYKFCEILTKFGKELSEFDLEIQRFIYWRILKCFWNEEHGWGNSVITNFDWYHPAYAYRYTPEEIERWIAEADLEAKVFDVGESGISMVVKNARVRI